MAVWRGYGPTFTNVSKNNATGGAALKQYIWLGDTPLAVIDTTTLYYVHPDHLDRPVAMTNASAMTLARSAKYDPFGVPVAVTTTPVNNQRLPGQWFQSEDGLGYNWYRTYDPTLGRYTQADPLGFVDGPGLYRYAGQSPVIKVDPLGLAQTGAAIGGLAGDAVGGALGGRFGFGPFGSRIGRGIGAAVGSAIEDMCYPDDCTPANAPFWDSLTPYRGPYKQTGSGRKKMYYK